jgi:hypothetical protein
MAGAVRVTALRTGDFTYASGRHSASHWQQRMHRKSTASSALARRLASIVRRTAAALPLAAASVAAVADAPSPLYLRNMNPLQQTLGAPALQGGELTPEGAWQWRWILNMSNHAEYGLNTTEELVFDGETYVLDLVLRYGAGERLELGASLPLVAHTGGMFDKLIENWHDLLDFTDADRNGTRNLLHLGYQRDGGSGFEIDDERIGLGDVRLTAAYRLAGDDGARTLALRAQVELPTGDAEQLLGNGAFDWALALDATDRLTLAGAGITLFGRLGVVAPGSGDLLADQQRDWVPLASAGLAWQAAPRLALHAQLDYDGAYYDSQLDELGRSTRLALGGSYRFGERGPRLSLALTENLFSDATPDFGLYFALTMASARD